MDHSWVLSALNQGELVVEGQFLNSSNYTFLAKVLYRSDEMATVYKPQRGERPLWDFPASTLAKREVAAYQVSEALGWELVPPTVFRREAPLGPGSLQQFINHDPVYHYFNFSDEDRRRLRPVVTYDLLVNNADRKGSHILIDADGHMWLIDHGVCFHREDKLRTVLWDFCGDAIPQTLLDDLGDLLAEIEKRENIYQELRTRLQPDEIEALADRARQLISNGVFPHPSEEHRPYPWPPI